MLVGARISVEYVEPAERRLQRFTFHPVLFNCLLTDAVIMCSVVIVLNVHDRNCPNFKCTMCTDWGPTGCNKDIKMLGRMF